MDKKEIFEACGFYFSTKEQSEAALEEEKKIYYIRTKLDFNDMSSVLLIYNKMIKNNVLKTPVGMVFLKELNDKLRESPDIDALQIEGIPFYDSYFNNGASNIKASGDTGIEKEIKQKIKYYKYALAFLIICVIAMFIITLNADNPNILNYETAIQNKYASWEEEIRSREDAVREKEAELGIDNE